MTSRWGATEEEWNLFITLNGVGDLLPVVSKPDAKISPASKMQGVGKTPSVYNKQGFVVGIPGWTSLVSSQGQVQSWQKNPDLGICIQTRSLRAIDIDVNDALLADIIVYALGIPMPKRYRSNSGKCLLVFRMQGEFSKRVIKVEGGIVEFLANGQQFIAAGTHPSGVRYEWDFNGLDNFPELTEEEFETLWGALQNVFAIETPKAPGSGGPRKPPSNEASAEEDEVLTFLDENGYVKEYTSEGDAYITCPFEAEHTQDTGASATMYFVKGSRDYPTGNFCCKHGHCTDKTKTDFLNKIGFLENIFNQMPIGEDNTKPIEWKPIVIPGGSASTPPSDVYPPFKPGLLKRDDKSLTILATLPNVLAFLAHPPTSGVEIKYDIFQDDIIIRRAGGKWQRFRDVEYGRLRVMLESKGMAPVGPEIIKTAVLITANDNQIDTAIAWLKAQKWDGVPRIDNFLRDYLGAEDTPYTRAVGSYIFTGFAGRVMDPGCQADMAPILQGVQGTGKTSAIRALSPSPDQFCNITLNMKDADLSREVRGKLVVEIPELSGMRSRDVEAIKHYISKREEQWVPKYQEFSAIFARRMLFFGTTNSETFLVDDTGERRWLPFAVGKQNIEKIKKDRAQLWAEGYERYKLLGVDWQEAQKLAPAEHEKFKVENPDEETIYTWMRTPFLGGSKPSEWETLQTDQVATGAFPGASGSNRRSLQMTIGRVLRKMDYKRKDKREGDEVFKAWFKPQGSNT